MADLVMVAALGIWLVFACCSLGFVPPHRWRIRKAARARGWEVGSIQSWAPRISLRRAIPARDMKRWYRVRYVEPAAGTTKTVFCRVGFLSGVEWSDDDVDPGQLGRLPRA